MSHRNQRTVPVSSPSPGDFSTLKGGSYLTANITNAGTTSIYALAGGGGGGSVYYDQIFTSSLTSYSTITTGKIGADTGVFNTIRSLSSITVDATEGNLKVLGGIDLDGNVLTTSSGAGGELLLNGVPIATTGSISSITTWSEYPAISSINADGYNILNPNAIIAQDGNDLAIRASVGNSLILQGEITFDNLGGVLPAEVKLTPTGLIAFGQTKVGQLTNISTINGLNVDTIGGVASVNGLTGALTLSPGSNISFITDSGAKSITINASGGGTGNTITGANTFMTATGATLATANSIITAGGGIGGNIQLTASAGDLGVSGGNISLVSNGGTGLGGLYGVINMTAQPGTDLVSGLATGGSINILANSPTVGATSKVAITGGGVNIYSGIFTPLASVFGYTFINASLGISLVSGGFSPFPQSPGTTYIYGAQGIILDNGVYATDIQPIWDGNPLVPPAPLTIHGRTAGGSNVPVILNNVNNISMQGDGNITGVNNINGSPYPPSGSSAPNLVVSTITFNPLGYISSLNQINDGILINETGSKISFLPNLISEYIGEFDGVKSINENLGIGSFGESITFAPDVNLSTIGAINGLSTINGQAWVNGGGGYNPDPSFSTITMATDGTITFTGDNGIITGVQKVNDVSFSGYDITGIENLSVETNISLAGKATITLNGLNGSEGQVIGIPTGGTEPRWVDAGGGGYNPDPSFSTITLASAGTITLEASAGSPGQYIGIATDGTTPAWLDLPAVGGGVNTLNGENGTVVLVEGTGISITPDTGTGNITITATGATTAGVLSLNTLQGELTLSSSNASIDIGEDGTTINFNLAESITLSALTIASAGTITLETSAGSPGQYIGIATDGTTPAWLDLPAVGGGVSALNGLTGTVDIVSPDGSIFVNAVDGEVNLTQNRDVPVSVITPTADPEVIVPVSGTFYAIVPDATYDTVSFNMSGFSGGTTFTVKNVATTNHNLNIEFNDGTGSVAATGVNLPLLHPTNSFNSVMALCYWDGATLFVY
jgi:hypothetical protein